MLKNAKTTPEYLALNKSFGPKTMQIGFKCKGYNELSGIVLRIIRSRAYYGGVKLDNFSGPGAYIHLETGSTFCGNFKEGLKQGFGIWKSGEDGRFYEGEFKDGFPHGEGRMYFPDSGYSYHGLWNNSVPVERKKVMVPELQQSIESGTCVSTLEHFNQGHFGSFFYRFKKKNQFYCEACFKTRANHEFSELVKKLTFDQLCEKGILQYFGRYRCKTMDDLIAAEDHY
jgi:hypothetical protein